MSSENAYGENQSSLEYWQNSRKKLSDLYESERYFLEPILKKISSVLDLGCAAGGSFQICKEVNPSIRYTGIDISPELIMLAKKNHPNSSFACYDGHTIHYSPECFDLGFSIGVLHHLPHWKEMILQMLSVCKKYVVFDLRLTKNKTINDPDKYYQKIAFNEKWDGKTKISYIVLNVDEVYQFINEILGKKHQCEIYGYAGRPTELASIPYNTVYMCSFCITKNSTAPGLVDKIRW